MQIFLILISFSLSFASCKFSQRKRHFQSDSSCSDFFPIESSSCTESSSDSDSFHEKLICERIPSHRNKPNHRRHHRITRPYPLPPCPPIPRPLPPCPPMPCPLPPCPPMPCPLPPCPPKPCPPKPYPPAPYPCPPVPYPCPPKPFPNNCRIVLDSLDQLLIEKSADLSFIINSRGQHFINAVKDSLANLGVVIGNRVTALNNALNTTILGILTASNTATTNAVVSSINTTNATLLSGVNSLINTTNASISSLITALAAQTAANIATIVQNLTTSTGLLAQLLAITGTLSNGVSTLFSSTTPGEISDVTNILANATQSVQAQVTQAITTTNAQILQVITQALVAETSVIVNLFERFINEVLAGTEALFSEYGYEVRRIVSNALGCNGFDIGTDIFRSRRPTYRAQFTPVLTAPLVNLDSLVNTNIGSNTITTSSAATTTFI